MIKSPTLKGKPTASKTYESFQLLKGEGCGGQFLSISLQILYLHNKAKKDNQEPKNLERKNAKFNVSPEIDNIVPKKLGGGGVSKFVPNLENPLFFQSFERPLPPHFNHF